MARVAVWVVVLLLGLAGSAAAQKVTGVPSVDVIEVEGIGKVRLVGIAPPERLVQLGPTAEPSPPTNRPETPPPAIVGGRINLAPNRSARTFLRGLVLGKTVVLQYEKAGEPAPGQVRAYVFLGDGQSVNAELIRQGRARVDPSAPFARLDEYQQLERDARAGRRGVWAETAPPR
jgi:endonuclease YncB( thermonuclease family)